MSGLARAGLLMALAAVLASSNARGAGPYPSTTPPRGRRTPAKGDVPCTSTTAGSAADGRRRRPMVAYAISQWNSVAKAKHRRGMGEDDLKEHLDHGDTIGICGNGH